MLSLRIFVPDSSILVASSTTGPRTSYKTLFNFDDFKNTGTVKIFANKKVGFLDSSFIIPRNEEWVNKWKLYVVI